MCLSQGRLSDDISGDEHLTIREAVVQSAATGAQGPDEWSVHPPALVGTGWPVGVRTSVRLGPNSTDTWGMRGKEPFRTFA